MVKCSEDDWILPKVHYHVADYHRFFSTFAPRGMLGEHAGCTRPIIIIEYERPHSGNGLLAGCSMATEFLF